MNKYRFHLLSFADLPVSERYSACAYTQKIIKFSKMMLSLGHETYIYGAENSDAPCTEFIQTHTLQDIKDTFGDGTDNELGYDWFTKGIDEKAFVKMAKRTLYPKFLLSCITEINKRKKKDDFICCIGEYHKPIEQAVGLELGVEIGIGYTHSYLPFRAFESNALMNHIYGAEYGKHIIRPSMYNRVIPNYFDPRDFEYKEKKQGFLLFIGRCIYAKGITVAVKVADALNKKLIIAGQGVYSWDAKTKRLTGREFDVTSKNIEYIGYADKELRKQLMADADCVLVPSMYTEPFGGVNVEAQLSGTPVLTTSFGAFPETVRHGETGFICYSNDEFIANARKAWTLDPKVIRKHAERYLMDTVKWEYQAWFDMIYSLVIKKTS